jgi:hypothetical protein
MIKIKRVEILFDKVGKAYLAHIRKKPNGLGKGESDHGINKTEHKNDIRCFR